MSDIDLKTLSIDPQKMRQLGYRIVDMIVDHHHTLLHKPVASYADRSSLSHLLHEPPPELPCDPDKLIDTVERDVLSHMAFAAHPRFFAYIPGPANFIGAMGDALASGFNVINTLWLEGSGPTQLELTAVDWMRQWCGLPEGAGGLFVSGGSVANLTALAVARQIKLDNETTKAVVYCSDQTHGSLQKNLKLLGFSPQQFIKIKTDHEFRIDVSALGQRITQDIESGRRPFCVIANAGTTNTGAVDPLSELSTLCRQHGLWLHVDGAYGVPAVLTKRGKNILRGLDLADSIVVDPHKWLFQPFEIGCVLVRDARWLPQTFGQEHEYMQDAELSESQAEVNFCDYGIQLTRGCRAFKFWMTIKTFGVAAIRNAIDRGLELAEYAQSCLHQQGCFEIVSPAHLGIVGFRYLPSDQASRADAVNLSIVDTIFADGSAMVSSTRLNGQVCLRLCTINPKTTRADIERTVELIAAQGKANC